MDVWKHAALHMEWEATAESDLFAEVADSARRSIGDSWQPVRPRYPNPSHASQRAKREREREEMRQRLAQSDFWQRYHETGRTVVDTTLTSSASEGGG